MSGDVLLRQGRPRRLSDILRQLWRGYKHDPCAPVETTESLYAIALPRRGDRLGVYGTGQGFASQISAAYSAMVRSLENFPELAMFRMALRVHSCGSA